MLRYQEFDHTADIGVEIYGQTLTELFCNAGYALFDTLVDAATIRLALTRTVTVTGSDVEILLINWLRELLYLFAVEQEVYAEFEIVSGVQTEGCTPTLTAIVKGEPFDPEKHDFRTEIKAVTYHLLAVTQANGIWTARVLFDV